MIADQINKMQDFVYKYINLKVHIYRSLYISFVIHHYFNIMQCKVQPRNSKTDQITLY